MANRDHTLDGPITQAAMAEFLANGYERASLRKIAAAAGVTVGAIYTRYPTKDSLFCALVKPLLDRIEGAFTEIRSDYYGPAGLPEAMQREGEAILHLLFDDYDRSVLLLCRSTGSSLEHFSDLVVERKIQETQAFFQAAGAQVHPDPGVMRLLLTAQFHNYFQIIETGCSLEEAREMMAAVMVYHTGGWTALLNRMQGPWRGENTK